MKTYNFLLLKP